MTGGNPRARPFEPTLGTANHLGKRRLRESSAPTVEPNALTDRHVVLHVRSSPARLARCPILTVAVAGDYPCLAWTLLLTSARIAAQGAIRGPRGTGAWSMTCTPHERSASRLSGNAAEPVNVSETPGRVDY